MRDRQKKSERQNQAAEVCKVVVDEWCKLWATEGKNIFQPCNYTTSHLDTMLPTLITFFFLLLFITMKSSSLPTSVCSLLSDRLLTLDYRHVERRAVSH